MGKEVDYSRGRYYHPSHTLYSMVTILNALAWMCIAIFMCLQNRKWVRERERVLEEDWGPHAYVFS